MSAEPKHPVEQEIESKNIRLPRRFRRLERWTALLLVLTGIIIGLLEWEIRTSRLSAMFFHNFAKLLVFVLDNGENPNAFFPRHGPYDERLGYTRIPQLTTRLKSQGYEIEKQARLSPPYIGYVASGFYPIYHEKSQAGLEIYDEKGNSLFSARQPQSAYKSFEEIPDVVVKTLLFIEDQKLLDQRFPYRNPAVEWSRLVRAVWEKGTSLLMRDRGVPGGSTLATQMEKFKHSPDGLTKKPEDKFIQMVSASLRSFQDSERTLEQRKQIVVNYINTVPSGAKPVFGEVLGLGSGLKAWYGNDFTKVNGLLKDLNNPEAGEMAEKAKAYKQVLSLFLAHRRPNLYLQKRPQALADLTDRYLNALTKGKIITPEFAAIVRQTEISLAPDEPKGKRDDGEFLERKSANAVRLHLLTQLGLKDLYEFDRFDMKVDSTINQDAQREVTRILSELRDPEKAQGFGLRESHLLETGDPSKVLYSFVLMERVGDKNLLRVQTDSLDGPFNLNESGKLELGSTAKLRVLVSYMQVMERLHGEFSVLTPEKLRLVETHDPLSNWVQEQLLLNPQMLLSDLLSNALDRSYSANPAEAFISGGALHRFSNFNPDDNFKHVSVLLAFTKSMNLPFVRILRDVVNYHMNQLPDYPAVIKDLDHPLRRSLLERFAERESQLFLLRPYRKYKGKTLAEALELLAPSLKPTHRAFAVGFRTIHPEGSIEAMRDYITSHITKPLPPKISYETLYKQADAASPVLNLHDRGYVAGIHPLDLWMIRYFQISPNAGWTETVKESHDARLSVYKWLIEAKNRMIQNGRIKTMLEEQAFAVIGASWRELGFPFATIVPTLASALGSSGDRPSALAELIGIIQAEGMRSDNERILSIKFAEGTPYETILAKKPTESTRVLSQQVAQVVQKALYNVVDEGTARRVKDVVKVPTCENVRIGGKTGTGDNRYQLASSTGDKQNSRVINRTATFVFSVGDRYFGTVTAYVPSDAAAEYGFTSALPAQVLKIIAPQIMPSPLGFEGCQAASTMPTVDIKTPGPWLGPLAH